MPLNVELGRRLAEDDNKDNRGQLVCTNCKQPSTVDPEARKPAYDNLIIGGLLSDCTRCGCVGWIAGARGMSGGLERVARRQEKSWVSVCRCYEMFVSFTVCLRGSFFGNYLHETSSQISVVAI
jgi:hypothetical protein